MMFSVPAMSDICVAGWPLEWLPCWVWIQQYQICWGFCFALPKPISDVCVKSFSFPSLLNKSDFYFLVEWILILSQAFWLVRMMQCVDGWGARADDSQCDVSKKPVESMDCQHPNVTCGNCMQNNCSGNGYCSVQLFNLLLLQFFLSSLQIIHYVNYIIP